MNKKSRIDTLLFILTAISFSYIFAGLITDYNEILNHDYSYFKAMWEIFKISWWRVPIMIINILIAFS